LQILFDQGTPVLLRLALSNHTVATAFEMGWSDLGNGDLLRAAEGRFNVFITTDQNLRYQQNLAVRQLPILVLPTTSWSAIKNHLGSILNALDSVRGGDYLEISFFDEQNLP
jgi:hypothetical protein